MQNITFKINNFGNKIHRIILAIGILILSSCSDDDRYSGKSDAQKIQMYHEAKIKIVMRWTCNVLSEEVYTYKQNPVSISNKYASSFNDYPAHFMIATTLYKPVIISTLRDHPYKIPPNQLDISYIKPFDLSELSCNAVVAEWRSAKADWVEFLRRN